MRSHRFALSSFDTYLPAVIKALAYVEEVEAMLLNSALQLPGDFTRPDYVPTLQEATELFDVVADYIRDTLQVAPRVYSSAMRSM